MHARSFSIFFFNNLIVKFKFNPLANSKITSLITSFVQLLDKAVIDLCKNSHEYFKVLFNYADLVISKKNSINSLNRLNYSINRLLKSQFK